jgi:hypothetical protein
MVCNALNLLLLLGFCLFYSAPSFQSYALAMSGLVVHALRLLRGFGQSARRQLVFKRTADIQLLIFNFAT